MKQVSYKIYFYDFLEFMRAYYIHKIYDCTIFCIYLFNIKFAKIENVVLKYSYTKYLPFKYLRYAKREI